VFVRRAFYLSMNFRAATMQSQSSSAGDIENPELVEGILVLNFVEPVAGVSSTIIEGGVE
jgi:hypothetical protein